MSTSEEPLQENEVGTFGDLAARPNPHRFVILHVPAFEELLPRIEHELGRKLSTEEIEIRRNKSPALVMSKVVAEKMSSMRANRVPVIAKGSVARVPKVKTAYSEMPIAPKERKEAAVELFGQHLFYMRNHLVNRIRTRVESEESRKQLAGLQRKEFDAVASFKAEDRETAVSLARKSVDLYMQEVLTLLTGIGDSLAFGLDHAINYSLMLQVKDVRTDEIVEEFEVNRDLEKVFYDYFGRWLNRYDNHQ